MTRPKNSTVRINTKSSKKLVTVRPSRVSDAPNESAEVSPTLDALRLKQAYTFEYRSGQRCWGAVVDYIPSRSYDSQGVWRNAAEVLRSKNIEPLRYVRVLFSDYRSSCHFQARGPKADRPSTPADLVSDETFAKYEDVLRRQRRIAEVELIMERQRLVHNYNYLRAVKPEWNARYCALVDTCLTTGLFPLARFSVATHLIQRDERTSEVKKSNAALRRIADDCFENACYQYSHNETGYSACWPAEFLSPKVVRKAVEVYESYISKVEF